jgi:flagellar hook assembly protein FlgD
VKPVANLGRVEPNPFETYTSVPFSLETECQVLLEVYDVGGRRVKTLVGNSMRPGSYTSVWDGTDELGRPVPQGIYFFRFHAGGRSLARKAILAK